MLHSVTRLLWYMTVKHTVFLVSNCTVRLNSDLFNRREIGHTDSAGKSPVVILLIPVSVCLFVCYCFIEGLLFVCFCVFFVFVSGPAHILCPNVASGCNKEQYIPEIEVIVTFDCKILNRFICCMYVVIIPDEDVIA
jgi:hypothetical protein